MGMVGVRDVFVVAPAASFHHQHHHHQYHDQILADHSTAAVNNAAAASNSNATALGVGVIPLLAATPCLVEESETAAHSRKVHHLWQTHHQMQQGEVSFFKKNVQMEENSNSGANVGGGGGNVLGGGSGIGAMGMGGGGTTCQDCGNQAKKDCSHRRCRTCCKSRGFDCATHVKSTWVPAARRRERQITAAAVAGSAGSTSSAKKPRLISSQTTTTSHTSTSNTTPPRSFDTGSSHQDATFRESLPGQVRLPAVFKCVRVTSIDDGEDEYAYQAVVKIGGHVFKGFLYDHGVEGRDSLPNISDLHLGGPSARNGASSSSFPALEPPDVYATSSGGLLGGTNYGNPLN
ncbi:protein LATERAL ROOT PRIMORDIUM 1-like protein [Cinnamomum micranthum f. kanehirae]|uniref:Protein LATERAL ROOT PRIMORDIUM 1-like protein n=1 Tax=Cinnamomum micranthum f. kanehirae TaxID=337451 RepID=A0A443PYD2_9MAGN|nr:protein LATERAL ROOT PRIMORDIUM 1-like protein [Cinnamomum micranthum f. kanehirae]